MRRSARNGEMNDTSTIRPGIDHQLCHLGDAADVLDAIGVGKPEITIEAVAHIVAVENISVAPHRMQALLQRDWRSSICPNPKAP